MGILDSFQPKTDYAERLVYPDFWRMSAERMRVFWRRYSDKAYPWTHDPILRGQRFTNPYRVLDRTSQYLLTDVIPRSESEEDCAFRVLLYKRFNLIGTWERLRAAFGEPRLATFQPAQYALEMDRWDEPMFSAAYLTTGVYGYGGMYAGTAKHYAILLILERWFRMEGIMEDLRKHRDNDPQGLFDLLRGKPTVSDFTAFQWMTDLNYADVVNYSEDAFVAMGPGSMRGVERCFHLPDGVKGRRQAKRIVEETWRRQRHESALYGGFPFLPGRFLSQIDVQNMFCEFDKYRRRREVLDGKRGRMKVRRLGILPDRLPDTVFPPKWGLAPLPRDYQPVERAYTDEEIAFGICYAQA